MSAVMPSSVSIAPPRGGLLTGQMWSVLLAFVVIVSVGEPVMNLLIGLWLKALMKSQAEVSRKSVAVGKEYDRIQREKAELIRQMQALTLRESTLEAQVASVPELYAELAGRRRAE